MIVKGLWLLARGRPDGVKEFGNTQDALTASLGPLIGFPLVGAGITAVGGQWQMAVLAFLARLCAVLVLPVIIHEYARRTGREAAWLRTAAALNWSFWMVVPALLAAAMAGALLVEAGLPDAQAEYAALGMIAGYLLWYHWFTLRAGLQLGMLQAAVLTALNSLAIGLLTAGPEIIDLVAHALTK